MPITTVGGPLPTEARRGRQKQKYGQCGERLVAGCIPYRLVETDSSPVEVLLITTRRGVGWVLPKGGWESDEDIVESAALRETVEEAGVRGELDKPVLGVFEFKTSKIQSPIKTCLAHVFAMRVIEQLDAWPEQPHRERRWFSLGDAYHLCKHDWMRKAFEVWMKRNNWVPIVLNGVNNQAIDEDEQLARSDTARI